MKEAITTLQNRLLEVFRLPNIQRLQARTITKRESTSAVLQIASMVAEDMSLHSQMIEEISRFDGDLIEFARWFIEWYGPEIN